MLVLLEEMVLAEVDIIMLINDREIMVDIEVLLLIEKRCRLVIV